MTRVLVVDDDAGLRHSLGLLLSESGFEVVAEGDPLRGLELAGREPFDIILCDVRMPRIEGREFLRRYLAAGGSPCSRLRCSSLDGPAHASPCGSRRSRVP